MKKYPKAYYWPLWLEQSLTKNKKTNTKYCQFQLKLWKALNIYDDFYDDEGNKILLPQANQYFREYINFHYQLSLPSSFYNLFNSLFKDLEEMNLKEMKDYQFKKNANNVILPKTLTFSPQILAKKSLVLALNPLALMIKKYKISKQEQNNIINFFTYALAAKQLSDDSKDWLEDIKNRKITFVTHQIINNKKININNTTELMISFIKISAHLSKTILFWCKLAKKELKHRKNDKIITELITPLEKAALKALYFHQLLKKI